MDQKLGDLLAKMQTAVEQPDSDDESVSTLESVVDEGTISNVDQDRINEPLRPGCA